MRVVADHNLLSDLLPVEARKTLQLAEYIYIGLDSV